LAGDEVVVGSTNDKSRYLIRIPEVGTRLVQESLEYLPGKIFNFSTLAFTNAMSLASCQQQRPANSGAP
jgi:hypothetical protein|tara:strand:- start:122 stop:328 length:207 start_codon:yes stop_codon:yes gene_type:complete